MKAMSDLTEVSMQPDTTEDTYNSSTGKARGKRTGSSRPAFAA